MKKRAVFKAAIKQHLPFKNQLRRLARILHPYRDNPVNTRLAVRQGLQQIQMLKSVGADLTGTVLEFGSGWVPVIPHLFILAGSRRVIMTDIEPLMNADTHNLAKQAILEQVSEIANALGLSETDVERSLQNTSNLDYAAPWNSANHPAESVDIVISRTVFEHLPLDTLEAILREFQKILRRNGRMHHIIDNSDHWEHTDKSLFRLNYLRYEDNSLIWRLACINAQSYQNRLRHSDYQKLFNGAGWRVEIADGHPDSKAVNDLKKLPLAARFRGYDPDDLATLTSYFVLSKSE